MHKTAATPQNAWHTELYRWYTVHGRHDLPWRRTRDPYAIWVSEVMLQQTQVATVRARYYEPFLNRFPTLADLASACEQDVVKSWEGLGYYSRARNLHRAAQMAGKKMPRTVEGLLALPGIGKNTANAVASFAYNIPVPVMEANVKRLIHRVFAAATLSVDDLWAKAESLLDAQNPFDYNQAMMDVGSLVCTPKNPDCPSCPLSRICEGKKEPHLYPAKVRKSALPERRQTIIVLRSTDGKLYLEPRKAKFLGGIYAFPDLELPGLPASDTVEIKGHLFRCTELVKLGQVQHDYSHFRLLGEVWAAPPVNANGVFWHKPETVPRLPLSRTEKKVLALLPSIP